MSSWRETESEYHPQAFQMERMSAPLSAGEPINPLVNDEARRSMSILSFIPPAPHRPYHPPDRDMCPSLSLPTPVTICPPDVYTPSNIRVSSNLPQSTQISPGPSNPIVLLGALTIRGSSLLRGVFPGRFVKPTTGRCVSIETVQCGIRHYDRDRCQQAGSGVGREHGALQFC